MDDVLKTDSGLIKISDSLAINPDAISKSGLAEARAYAQKAIQADQIGSANAVSIPYSSQNVGIGNQVVENARFATEADRQAYEMQQAQREVDRSRQEIEARLQEKENLLRGLEQAEKEAGITDLRLEVADLTSQMESIAHSARRQIEAIEQRGGMSAGAIEAEKVKIQRDADRHIADISIVQSAKLRRQEALETAINRRMEIDLTMLQERLNWDKVFYQENRDQLTKAQDRAFQLRVQAEERAYQEEVMNKQQVGEIAKIAAMSGRASVAQMTKIMDSKDQLEAIFAAGDLLSDPLKRHLDSLNIQRAAAALKLDNLKIQEYESKEDLMNDPIFGNIIKQTAALAPVSDRSRATNDLSGYLATGNYKEAWTEMQNIVEGRLTSTAKNQFQNARNDLEEMAMLKTAIQAWVEANGDTNILRGSVNQIERKIGIAKDGPLSELAVQLDIAFQRYRHNMTGVAFSKQESKDYWMVNPRTTATLNLNLATINGAMNFAENSVLASMKRITNADTVYNLAKGGDLGSYLDTVDSSVSGGGGFGDNLDNFLNNMFGSLSSIKSNPINTTPSSSQKSYPFTPLPK